MFKLALIGCGRHALNNLVWPILRHGDMAIVALCDQSTAALEKATVLLPRAIPTHSITELLSSHAFDAAIVATSTSSHVEIASMLLENRVPCLVEKPLAVSVADAEAVNNLSAIKGVRCYVAFMKRFAPNYVLWRHHLQDHLFADSLIRITFAAGPYESRDLFLWEFVSHFIDLVVNWLFVGRCRVADAYCEKGFPYLFHARLIAESGATAMLDGTCSRTWNLVTEAVEFIHPDFSCAVRGGRGFELVRSDAMTPHQVVKTIRCANDPMPWIENQAWNLNGYTGQMEAFGSALRGAPVPLCDSAAFVVAARIIERILAHDS